MHVAKVLNAAEEAAEEIRAAAREDADRLLRRARKEAAKSRQSGDEAGARALAEAQELGQQIIATAHAAARAIEELALDRQARLRLQVRALEAQLEDALDAIRALDAGLLDAVPDTEEGDVGAVDLERLVSGIQIDAETPAPELAGVVTKQGDRWLPSLDRARAADRTVLLDRARELGIEGRLQMTTDELVVALERCSGTDAPS
ncbi:MAG: hypothetical protein KY396_07290 [Actinobacteria bacterium]|nr:hypothetical protein [Actinomycetota bacterium]